MQFIRFSIFVCTLLSCNDVARAENTAIEKGTIDLSQWQSDSDGIIPLAGQWKVWQQQIPSKNEILKGNQHSFKNIPGSWSDKDQHQEVHDDLEP